MVTVLRRHNGLYWQTLSGAPTYTPPSSIDNTGATDVAAKMQAWIASIPDNSVIDLGAGIYLCQSTVEMDNRKGLAIVGGTIKRTVERASPSSNFPWPHLWFKSPTRCRVVDTIFRGTDTVSDTSDPNTGSYDANKENDAAVRADSFNDFLVSGIDVDGVWGDGVQLQNGDKARLLNYHANRCGRQGTTPTGTNILIDGFTYDNARRACIDFEPDPSTTGMGNIEVRNCTLHTSQGLPFANGGSAVTIDNLYIHHNTFSGGGAPCFDCTPSDSSRRSNYRFENNVSTTTLASPLAAVFVNQVDGLSIIGNTIPVASSQSQIAVKLASCGGSCAISGNDFSPGGIYYQNVTPLASQVLTVQGGLTLQ